MFAEAYNPEEDCGEEEKVVHPKTDEQRTRLQEKVQSQLLFRTLDQDQLAEVGGGGTGHWAARCSHKLHIFSATR